MTMIDKKMNLGQYDLLALRLSQAHSVIVALAGGDADICSALYVLTPPQTRSYFWMGCTPTVLMDSRCGFDRLRHQIELNSHDSRTPSLTA